MGTAARRKKALEAEVAKAQKDVRDNKSLLEGAWAEMDVLLDGKTEEGITLREEMLREFRQYLPPKELQARLEDVYRKNKGALRSAVVMRLAYTFREWFDKNLEDKWSNIQKEHNWTELQTLTAVSAVQAKEWYARQLENEAHDKWLPQETFKQALSRVKERSAEALRLDNEASDITDKLFAEESVIEQVEVFSDEQLQQTGLTMWERTYKIGFSDEQVSDFAVGVAATWGNTVADSGVVVTDLRRRVVEAACTFSAKWAVHAFQRITTTHTYAAALMCSDADQAVLEDIELQWRAFMVCVPNGLLRYFDEERQAYGEYNRVLIASFESAALLIMIDQHTVGSAHRVVVQVAESVAKLLTVEDETVDLQAAVPDHGIGDKTRKRVARVITLAKRFVVGLLLALQHQSNFKSKTYPARENKSKRKIEEPEHRVVVVGVPLKIDCRPAVSDYIQNGSPKRKGAPPQVQTLVRGHYKRQVVGVGRLGRKVIFIQPFWRGPEDAPILTRPKKVGK